jgi:hypothetical protein
MVLAFSLASFGARRAAPALPKQACSVTYSLDATGRLQRMTLIDGFLVALNIIVLMMWVWRQWP